MRLYLDENLLVQEFKEKVIKEIDNSREKLENDIKSKMGTGDFSTWNYGPGQKYGNIKTTELKVVQDTIKFYVDANAIALYDNYGSGSKMDVENNPLIGEYIANGNWNPHRSMSDTRIKGRPPGEYTDIFGKKRFSGGSFEGVDLEGLRIYDNETGGYIVIKPHEPSHAIEYGLAWYEMEFPNILNRAIKNMNFSKCFSYK